MKKLFTLGPPYAIRKALLNLIADVFGTSLDGFQSAARVRTASELSPSLRPSFSSYHSETNCTALSPDGKHLIVGGPNSTAEVRSTTTGDLISTFDGHLDALKCVAISPNGEWAVSGGGIIDPTVRIWRLRDGKELRICQGLWYQGHFNPVIAIEVSPDNRTIASASTDGVVKVWSADTGAHLATIKRKGRDKVCSLAFSVCGTILACGDVGGEIELRSVSKNKPLGTLRVHSGAVTGLAFLVDSTSLVSSSCDGTVKVIDRYTGQTEWEFDGHAGPVTCMAAFLGGERVATGGEDGTVQILNPRTRTVEHVLTGHGYGVDFVAASFDEHTVLVSGSRRKFYKVWAAER